MRPKRQTEHPEKKYCFYFAFVRLLLASVLLLLLCNVVFQHTGTAHAGAMTRSCKELILFENGNVNNYVKQFAGVTDPRLPLDKAGKMLALLVQLDGLYSQIGYGSLGYIYIKIRDPQSCTNELVFKRLMGKACCSSGKLQKGKAALIFGGNFQRVKNQIYLLTEIEFLRRSVNEAVKIHTGIPGTDWASFIAPLPDTRISFTPRKFTKQQLEQVAHAYSDVMDVRNDRDMNSLPRKISPFDIDGFSYYIKEIQDGWLNIRSFSHQLPSGWVKVPQDIDGRGLREFLPELYFMDATALYLQTRIGSISFSSSRYERYLEKFESLMGEFEKRIQGSGDRRALGLMKSMYAALLLEKPGSKSKKDMTRISTIAAEASDLLPTSSAAMSLAALIQFVAMIPSEGLSHASSGLEKDLLQALSADPSNIYIKANLERLWQLRTSHDKSNWQNSKLISLRERFQKDSRIEQLLRQ